MINHLPSLSKRLLGSGLRTPISNGMAAPPRSPNHPPACSPSSRLQQGSPSLTACSKTHMPTIPTNSNTSVVCSTMPPSTTPMTSSRVVSTRTRPILGSLNHLWVPALPVALVPGWHFCRLSSVSAYCDQRSSRSSATQSLTTITSRPAVSNLSNSGSSSAAISILGTHRYVVSLYCFLSNTLSLSYLGHPWQVKALPSPRSHRRT